jgi:hypothetical protein
MIRIAITAAAYAPSLAVRDKLNTAWIDRPVDTWGLHSLLPRSPRCSVEVQPCSSHRDSAIWRPRH